MSEPMFFQIRAQKIQKDRYILPWDDRPPEDPREQRSNSIPDVH